MTNKVSVIGSGVWGLAISELLAKNGCRVSVLSCYEDETKKINEKYGKSSNIFASTDFRFVNQESDFIFIVVPSNAVSSVFNSLIDIKIPLESKIIICSKGIEGNDLQLFSDCFEKKLPNYQYAILSGPNFADEVTNSFPTTTTIASKNNKTANQIVNLLKNDDFLPVASDDVISAQIFGSIKNIFAIGCGIIDGLKLGENAKAALVIKGIIESNLLIIKLGGNPIDNFISPCGLGDLFLTCSSKKSRNNTLGYMIGSGKKIQEILDSGTTFEGFNASQIMLEFANKHQATLPLCKTINKILQNNFTVSEIKNIISNIILSN